MYLWLTSGTISCWPMLFYGWLLHMPVIQLLTMCRGVKLWCADGWFSLLPEAELCSCPVFPSVWVAGRWSITLCLAVGVAKSGATGSASPMIIFGALKIPRQFDSSASEWSLRKWEQLVVFSWKVCAKTRLLKSALGGVTEGSDTPSDVSMVATENDLSVEKSSKSNIRWRLWTEG